MRVAVTGATGFIGRHLVARLTGRGASVLAIVRRDAGRPFQDRDVEVVLAPLGDAPALAAACRGVDVVVHLAGLVAALSEGEYHRVNTEGTRAVGSAARDAGARLVYVSSLAAAGPASPASPRSEADAPAPITPYGRTKLAGETAVRSMDSLRWTILRPGVVYGPGDRALLPFFRFAASRVMPVVGRAGAAYTFGYIDDVVRSIEAAINRDAAGETVFVGHPRPVTPRELLETVRAAVGRRAAIVRVPQPLTLLAAAACDAAGRLVRKPLLLNLPRYADLNAAGFVCRVDRLRDRLGVVPEVDLRDGIARTAEWYRREGWI